MKIALHKKHDKSQVVVFQLLNIWIKCLMMFMKMSLYPFTNPKIEILQASTSPELGLLLIIYQKTKASVCVKTTLALERILRKLIVMYIYYSR